MNEKIECPYCKANIAQVVESNQSKLCRDGTAGKPLVLAIFAILALLGAIAAHLFSKKKGVANRGNH